MTTATRDHHGGLVIPPQHAPEAHTSEPGAAPQPTTPLTPAQLEQQLEKATAVAVADFDLDAWINAVGRPEEDVLLHNPIDGWAERYEEASTAWQRATARVALAKKAEEGDAERSITDLGSAGAEAEEEAALLALKALIDERDAAALRVRIQQRTSEEIAAGHVRGRKELPPEWSVAAVVADAILSVTAPDGRELPPFTAAQLHRLAIRDVTGWEQFTTLRQAIDRISARPTVPSLPGSSTSRGTGESSAR